MITMKTINKGFSLVEMIITITVSTIFIVFIVGSSFTLYRNFNRSQEKALVIKKMSEFLKTVSIDIYNPDIFPHHPVKDYTFSENSLTFFANGKKVEYGFSGKFYINKNDDKKEFAFIKDFKVSYLNKDGLINYDDTFPFSCEMKFIFYDNNEIKLQMRL
jgi:prepilin-type N-terminal cleavage/methylation domain-containing protein